jgi:hypothetical protein
MPEWLTHVLFAYILCSILGMGLKIKLFSIENTAIVLIGALLPDLVKVGLGFELMGVEVWDFIAPLHTPVGSLLVAALISLLFYETVMVFSLLIVGFVTHYLLDLLLGTVSGGGMHLLFPFSWHEYQLGLIQCDDYRILLIMVSVALIISLLRYRTKERQVD